MSMFADEIPTELRSPSLEPTSGKGLWGAMLTMAFKYGTAPGADAPVDLSC